MTSTSLVTGVSPVMTISRGGDRRDFATGHGLGRCWVLWRARAEPCLWVVELDQMVAGINAGERSLMSPRGRGWIGVLK